MESLDLICGQTSPEKKLPETVRPSCESIVADGQIPLDAEDMDDTDSEESGSTEGSESAVDSDRSLSALDGLDAQNSYYLDSDSDVSVTGSTESLPLAESETPNPDAGNEKAGHVSNRCVYVPGVYLLLKIVVLHYLH